MGFEPRELVAKLFTVAGQLGREQSATRFRVVVKTGPDGGQTVDHVHALIAHVVRNTLAIRTAAGFSRHHDC